MKRIPDLLRLGPCGRAFVFCAVTLLTIAVLSFDTSGQSDENFESPVPILLTENNGPIALAADYEKWRGTLPRTTATSFLPGQRIVLFVKYLELLRGEGANAFRLFGRDKHGERFRFAAEGILELPRHRGVYGVVVKLRDPNGYNGQPATESDLALTLSWRGNISNAVQLPIGTSRDDRDKDLVLPQAPARIHTTISQYNNADRKRFMEQATFGPSRQLDSQIRRLGYRAWLDQQFTVAYPTIPYPNFPIRSFDPPLGCPTYGSSPEANLCHRDHYWAYNNQKWLVQEALYSDAQLRRRVSWALHQIWVVAHQNINQQRGIQEYIEILDRNAFGNYRDLMREMTLSPAMGEYLDMVRSTRQNPNENYPRELLQLFTIGLFALNQDGTLILDNQGNRIPTYDQEKINQFTKVFTGWTHCNNGLIPECPNAVPAIPNYIDPMYLANSNNHDQTAKTLFNYPGAPNPTIAACTNCTNDAARRAYAMDSLNKTLDNIFHHPNLGPYIGRVLIQHLVTSDPSPAYVSRVAAAFNNNGTGVRGDMKAVIRAILLDPEARGSQKTDPTYGKLREPLVYYMNILRTFGAGAASTASNGTNMSPPASCQGRSDGVFEWAIRESGQDHLNPPSVFSYFPPDYVVPGTDILGPEFALANTGSSFTRSNYSSFFAFGGIWFDPATAQNPYPWVTCGTAIDRTELLEWANADPTGGVLVEGLNQRMMHGTMSPAMKTTIRNAVNFPSIDAWNKTAQALYLVASSSQYQIQR